MKAFVTGSTGLLGSNLVRLLSAQGHAVKGLARSREKAVKTLGDTKAEIVVGDMEDVAGFAAHLAGSDVLFHTAAYFREYYGPGDHWAKLKQINVDATMQLLNEAERSGVKKVIYVSSSGVIGATSDGAASDETTPPDTFTMQNLYFKSKVVAEEAIAAWLKTHPLPVVLILPTLMYGPGDAAPTTAGQLILDFVAGKIPAIPPGGFAVVDARDVAQAMLNAVERGKRGERYIVSERHYSIEAIFRIVSQFTGTRVPSLRMPYLAALAFAWFSEQQSRLTGRPAAATVNGIRTLNAQGTISSVKAMRELGVTFRPFEESLRDEVAWFEQHGYLRGATKLAAATA